MTAIGASFPGELEHITVAMHGDPGRAWLARLPALVATCEARWSCTVGPAFANLTYNYVAPVSYPDGRTAVLKISFVEPEPATGEHGYRREAEALRRFDGRGAARLLAADLDQGILLLERLAPGTPLSAIDDVEATAIAAEVMGQLWRPCVPEPPFLTVAERGAQFARLRARFDGGTGPLPAGLVERAERIFAERAASAGASMLLHGDLHHDNILAAEREPWLAIDPKGVIGDPAYEVAAFLLNPWRRVFDLPHPEQLCARRIAQFADALGFERERLRDWGLAQAMLGAWWDVEDGTGDPGYAIAMAELFAGLAI